MESLSSNNLQFYTMYTTVDVTQTGNYSKMLHKKILIPLVQMIAMFSQVIILNDPVNVGDLNAQWSTQH